MRNKSIGWSGYNQKQKNSWFDRDCPEWLWIGMFLIFIGIWGAIMLNFNRIDPGEALACQKVQIDDKEVKTPLDAKTATTEEIRGVASWYDYSLNGIEWSKGHDTCAVRDFKRYSMIRVTNVDNGKSVDCYVNDYGPELGQIPERHVDLSSHAFKQIANLELGLINIKIEEIK